MTPLNPFPQPGEDRQAYAERLVQRATSGIDWLTLVWPRDARDDCAEEAIHEELQEQRERSEKVRPWKALGYEGIAGTGIRVGCRADTRILILSRETAASKAMTLLKSSGKATRLDIESTLLLRSAITSFGSFLGGSGSMSGSQRKRARKRTFISSTAGSFSVNIGSRSSETYLRVYDKGVESSSHPPGVRWRAEVEFKGRKADSLWTHIRTAEPTPNYFSSVVSSQLSAAGGWWPLPLDHLVTPTVGKHRVNRDPLRALQYFRKYCRRMAKDVCDAGLLPELLDALDIAKYLPEQPRGPQAGGPLPEQ